VSNLTPEEIEAKLRHLTWTRSAAGGRGKLTNTYPPQESITAWYFIIDPVGRQRLDHYGNDGEGWDSEAWEEEYAGPLYTAVKTALDKMFGNNAGFSLDISEKGHIDIAWRPPTSKKEQTMDDLDLQNLPHGLTEDDLVDFVEAEVLYFLEGDLRVEIPDGLTVEQLVGLLPEGYMEEAAKKGTGWKMVFGVWRKIRAGKKVKKKVKSKAQREKARTRQRRYYAIKKAFSKLSNWEKKEREVSSAFKKLGQAVHKRAKMEGGDQSADRVVAEHKAHLALVGNPHAHWTLKE